MTAVFLTVLNVDVLTLYHQLWTYDVPELHLFRRVSSECTAHPTRRHVQTVVFRVRTPWSENGQISDGNARLRESPFMPGTSTERALVFSLLGRYPNQERRLVIEAPIVLWRSFRACGVAYWGSFLSISLTPPRAYFHHSSPFLEYASHER